MVHFVSKVKNNLHTLYAQSRGITLAPIVLPRRLARLLAGAISKDIITSKEV